MNKPNVNKYSKFNWLYFVVSSGLTLSILMIIYTGFCYWVSLKNEETYSYLESVLRVEQKETEKLSMQYKNTNILVGKAFLTKDKQHAHVLDNYGWIMDRERRNIIIDSVAWLVMFFSFLFLNRLVKKLQL